MAIKDFLLTTQDLRLDVPTLLYNCGILLKKVQSYPPTILFVFYKEDKGIVNG